jgi:hypothetical protein
MDAVHLRDGGILHRPALDLANRHPRGRWTLPQLLRHRPRPYLPPDNRWHDSWAVPRASDRPRG